MGGLDLVEQIALGVPPPSQLVAQLECARLLRAQAAEHRRDSDPWKGIVGRARLALAGKHLAGFGGDGCRRDPEQRARRTGLRQVGGADRAGAVQIDVSNAALGKLEPVVVGVPTRARVAALRMAGPEAE